MNNKEPIRGELYVRFVKFLRFLIEEKKVGKTVLVKKAKTSNQAIDPHLANERKTVSRKIFNGVVSSYPKIAKNFDLVLEDQKARIEKDLEIIAVLIEQVVEHKNYRLATTDEERKEIDENIKRLESKWRKMKED